MAEFFIRTEDIKTEEIPDYFVETNSDRQIIDSLKSRNPIILVGSRGVGKSFLLKVAQLELLKSFSEQKALPVYVTFVKSSLLGSTNPLQFKHWMIARICTAIIRAIAKSGISGIAPKSMKILAGGEVKTAIEKTRVESIADEYEETWKTKNSTVDDADIPTVDDLKEAVEDLCDEVGIKRIVLLIDEAAHIFLPEQQRQFFTLFRDLRSPYIACNAAVYPGVTTYGETFQPAHDATLLSVDRDILDSEYTKNMKEIAEKQADSTLQRNLIKNGENFSILCYAATGNPRSLLKTVEAADRISGTQVNEVIREYYRVDIWSEHSNLTEKYPSLRKLIDWGRKFIESEVLPELKKKNDSNLADQKNTSAYFWIHRDAPENVKQALRILSYTGIVTEQATGIKATRAEIGSRYMVNLGCLFALESAPTSTALQIVKSLTPKRMTEYGHSHPTFVDISSSFFDFSAASSPLQTQLSKSIDILDISAWQKSKLRELSLVTVGDVLEASDAKLKSAYYVGDKRARRMRNAAVAAVLEYLFG